MAKSPIFKHFYGGFMGIPFRSPAAKEVPDPAQAQQATSLSDFGHASPPKIGCLNPSNLPSFLLVKYG
jgi:hypothetical protein